MLLSGERITIKYKPEDSMPIGAYAFAVDYDVLEKRIVPISVRNDAIYGDFYFYFSTVHLNRKFRLVHEEQTSLDQD